MQPIVQMQEVSLTYHSPQTETLAVDRLSLSVEQGELLGIVGPSGCGKTTILSLISGILPPSAGQVQICGLPADKAREKIGYMLQKDELFGWRTIRDNVLLGLEIRHRKTPADLSYADELLAKYSLADFKTFYPAQLSGGMRQRVALIRTLVLKPQLLLLDEPFSALDFQTRLGVVQDVHAILKTEGKTAVFVTHDISEAISMCDRIVVLSQRPSTVKEIVDLTELLDLDPMARRESPLFGKMFDRIWKNLEYKTEKS